jgi:DUF1680 family protein
VVLCAESVDQDGDDLDGLRVDPGVALRDAVTDDGSYAATATGLLDPPADQRWPYDSSEPAPGDPGAVAVRLVPYHRWARRGPTTMRVWLPRV